jgi:hypothetical protein
MDQINIPSITIDTPIPYSLGLRKEGQPLHGLRIPGHLWSDLAYVQVWEKTNSYHEGKPYAYGVRTVGLAPQTKRDKEFSLRDRAEMVAYVNAWIAKTVAAGLKKMAEIQADKNEMERLHDARIAKQIEDAGGIEQRRVQIVREGYDRAAKDSMQYESADVYGAIVTALINRTPIVIDEDTRAKIIARYEDVAKGAGYVSRHIEDSNANLDAYLNKHKTEAA